MKATMNIQTAILAFVFLASATQCTFSQDEIRGNGNVVKRTVSLPDINSLDVGGVFNVKIALGPQQKVEIETDENIFDRVIAEVDGGELELSLKKVKDIKTLNVYLTVKEMKSIEASGASSVESLTTLKGDKLELDVSGASEVDLAIDVNELESDLSGASDVVLTGRADRHELDVSGASHFKSGDLLTRILEVDVSGAGDADVHVSDQVTGEVSGASSLTLLEEPKKQDIRTSGASSVRRK